MIAARIPAPRIPPTNGEVRRWTMVASSLLTGDPGATTSEPSGMTADVAQTPMSTQGNQTTSMQSGWSTSSGLKDDEDFAVSQCW